MNEEYENQRMLTCIGNKRKLLSNIKELIEGEIFPLIQKDKLIKLDVERKRYRYEYEK